MACDFLQQSNVRGSSPAQRQFFWTHQRKVITRTRNIQVIRFIDISNIISNQKSFYRNIDIFVPQSKLTFRVYAQELWTLAWAQSVFFCITTLTNLPNINTLVNNYIVSLPLGKMTLPCSKFAINIYTTSSFPGKVILPLTYYIYLLINLRVNKL